MVGTGGNDRLIGTRGRDVVYAGGGNDMIMTGPGEDIVCAGAGHDGVNASSENDRIRGESGQDLIMGGPGVDLIDGGSGNDLMMGMKDDDKVFGGSGRYDIVSYFFKCYGGSSPCRGVSVNLKTHRGRGEGRDLLRSIEAIEGSDGADTLQGDNGRNVFWTFGDRDSARGLDGRDVLVGGKSGKPGNQNLYGGPGKDLLFVNGSYGTFAFGNGGDDRIYLRRSIYRSSGWGGGGEDLLVGQKDYADVLFGDDGPDRIYGRGGEDSLHGGFGEDQLVAGPQNDELRGGAGDDVMSGGPGADYFDFPRGRTPPENIHGGIDTITYDGSPEGVTVNLDAGTSEPGGWGGDQFPIDTPVEVLIGSKFNDDLTGSANDNGLFGDDGDDRLSGLDGADTLDGEDGTDTADGGLGEDDCSAETRTGCEGTGILPIDPPPLLPTPDPVEGESLVMPSLRFEDMLDELRRNIVWRAP